MRRSQTLLLALFLSSPALAAETAPIPVVVPARKAPVSFANEVADIFAAKCTGCHSAVLAENKLNLEEVPGILKGGKRGPAVVPGKAEASLLFQMASHRVEPVMPPKDKKDAKPLTSEELGLIKLWIDAGAKDDSENAEPPKPIALGSLPPGVHPINAVDMTADGTRVVCGRANVVQVYDLESGVEIISLGGHKDIIQSVRFSPDGRRLAAGSYQIVTLWNVPTGRLKATFSGHADKVKALAVARDGSAVVSASLDGTVRFWDPTGKQLRQFKAPLSQVLALAPSGKRQALGGGDNVVHIVDAADGKEVVALKGHSGPVVDLAFAPSGKKLVSVSADGTGRIWTLPEKASDPLTEPIILAGHKGPVRAVAVSPDERTIFTAGDDGTIRSWHAEDGKAGRRIASLEGPMLALAMSPDGKLLLAGSADKSARLYDLTTGSLKNRLTGHLGPVNSVAFSPDGSHFATAGGEGGIKVWETASGQGVIAFGHTAPNNQPIQSVEKVAFSGEGTLISASADKTLKVWTYEGSWSERPPLGPHAFRVLALDFNPDGTLLAAGGGEPSRSGEIRIWEVGKGIPVRTLDGLHSDTVFSLRFSPDGSKLASGAADKFLKVTQVSDGKELRAFEGHTHHVLAVDWKADGKQIVSGGADNVLKVWDVESGEQVRTLQGSAKQVTAVRWVPGKPEVAGASGDKTVRFWNADRGGVARTLSGPSDYVFGVSTSNDGLRVAAGGADGVLFLWNGQNGQVLRKIEAALSGK
jgi:WD40 repeat protein